MKKRTQKGMIAAALAAPDSVKKKLAPEIEHRVQPASLKRLSEIHPHFPRVKIEPPPLDYDPDYSPPFPDEDTAAEAEEDVAPAKASWLDVFKPNDDAAGQGSGRSISAVNSDENGIYRFFRNL